MNELAVVAAGDFPHSDHAAATSKGWILHTGNKPLSMYDPRLWAMCFPGLFPYSDGVFGIPQRRKAVSFQEWATMMLTRTELVYDVDDSDEMPEEQCPLVGKGHNPCCQCADMNGKRFLPPAQPRWSADLDFLCAVYDTWRRMELIRRAAGHIRRKGFQSNVKLVCAADSSVLQQTFQCLGENASLKGALQSPDVPACLKTALADLLLFSSEVQSAGG